MLEATAAFFGMAPRSSTDGSRCPPSASAVDYSGKRTVAIARPTWTAIHKSYMFIHTMPGLPFAANPTTAKVLALLSSMPGQELHTNEIARRTGSVPNAVQRALTQSEARGLIRSRRLGNLRLWSMDQQNPLYASLRETFARTYGVPAHLREVLTQDTAVVFAFLFGSYVTAQDDPTSDIDLFIVGSPDWIRLTQAVRNAGHELGREVNPVVWTENDLRRPTPTQRGLLDNILSAPMMWLVGDRSEFERRAAVGSKVAERRPTASRGTEQLDRQSSAAEGKGSRKGRKGTSSERKSRERARIR